MKVGKVSAGMKRKKFGGQLNEKNLKLQIR
jgi:hypothetical protein